MTGRAAPKPTMPTGLKAAGEGLWSAVVGGYELRHDEVRLLEDAARTADLIAAMQAELDSSSLMVEGSKGQARQHPLLTEVRGHRALLASLLKQLGLPDEGGHGLSAASRAGTKAAGARWGHDRSAVS